MARTTKQKKTKYDELRDQAALRKRKKQEEQRRKIINTATRSLPAVPKKPWKDDELGTWEHASKSFCSTTVSYKQFFGWLQKIKKKADAVGARRVTVRLREVRVEAFGDESPEDFAQRKQTVLKEREDILAARETVRAWDAAHRAEVAESREALLTATKSLTPEEFDRVLRDVTYVIQQRAPKRR